MSQTSDLSAVRLTAFAPPFQGAQRAARLRLQSAYGLPPPKPRQVPHQPNTRYPEKFPANGKLQKERYTTLLYLNAFESCQTDGKVLADRALSRLLRKDWPRTIEEWESAR